mmetsp:Transcript_20346/g.61296  ORF Transcript_20346/g.61296 Transcript_20346/m.61296 type:complete len:253 (-) Transcript_20346:1146-1904(-)
MHPGFSLHLHPHPPSVDRGSQQAALRVPVGAAHCSAADVHHCFGDHASCVPVLRTHLWDGVGAVRGCASYNYFLLHQLHSYTGVCAEQRAAGSHMGPPFHSSSKGVAQICAAGICVLCDEGAGGVECGGDHPAGGAAAAARALCGLHHRRLRPIHRALHALSRRRHGCLRPSGSCFGCRASLRGAAGGKGVPAGGARPVAAAGGAAPGAPLPVPRALAVHQGRPSPAAWHSCTTAHFARNKLTPPLLYSPQR